MTRFMKTATVSVLFAIISAGSAHAQFGLPKSLPGLGSDEKPVVAAATSDFYGVAFLMRVSMNEAELGLAKAFGLQEEARLLELEAERLESGSITAGGFKDSVSLSENTQKAISAKIDAGYELDEEGRMHFQNAIPPFIVGIGLLPALKEEGEKFIEEAKAAQKSASFTQKALMAKKAIEAAGVVKELKDYIPSTYNSGKVLINYGKSNEIPMPDNATDALGSL